MDNKPKRIRYRELLHPVTNVTVFVMGSSKTDEEILEKMKERAIKERLEDGHNKV